MALGDAVYWYGGALGCRRVGGKSGSVAIHITWFFIGLQNKVSDPRKTPRRSRANVFPTNCIADT